MVRIDASISKVFARKLYVLIKDSRLHLKAKPVNADRCHKMSFRPNITSIVKYS